jgi:hypothetical protein
MRTGDFSALLPNTVLYDPLTTCGITGAPACPAGRTNVRQAFPGNMIPQSRLDPAAKQILSYYGLPNLPGLVNNYATNVKIGGNTNQYNARMDYSTSQKQRAFARYSYWSGSSIPADTFGTHYGGLTSYTGSQDFVVGDTYDFSPTTIGDVRLSYVRATDGFIPEQYGTNLSEFGPGWGALASQVTIPVTPLATISGFTAFGGTYNRSFINDYSISASLTKILGRHTLKMGGEVRRNGWEFGWGVNGITILQSGFPMPFTTAANNTGSQGGGSRPNLVPGAQRTVKGSEANRVNDWFNTAAFSQPAAFSFGNENRVDSTIRDSGIANWDFTLSKNTPITERVNSSSRLRCLICLIACSSAILMRSWVVRRLVSLALRLGILDLFSLRGDLRSSWWEI